MSDWSLTSIFGIALLLGAIAVLAFIVLSATGSGGTYLFG